MSVMQKPKVRSEEIRRMPEVLHHYAASFDYGRIPDSDAGAFARKCGTAITDLVQCLEAVRDADVVQYMRTGKWVMPDDVRERIHGLICPSNCDY